MWAHTDKVGECLKRTGNARAERKQDVGNATTVLEIGITIWLSLLAVARGKRSVPTTHGITQVMYR